jgi:branched-chain amino acid transport system ATP-binding protein
VTSAPLLAIDGLSVSYGRLSAVRDARVSVAASKVATIIGPNGAGKTSLLKAVMGLLPSSGSILFDGEEISHLETEERVERGIVLVPETRDLFADMPVRDNLLLGAYARRRDRAGIDADFQNVYALFPRLAERAEQMAGTLSGGERQMLALGRALMGRPRVLMLDEPSLGLAPLIVRSILKTVAGLRSTGVTILLIEQNARAALETADYGYVLETGEVVHQGPASALISDPRVMASYLGGSAATATVDVTNATIASIGSPHG